MIDSLTQSVLDRRMRTRTRQGRKRRNLCLPILDYEFIIFIMTFIIRIRAERLPVFAFLIDQLRALRVCAGNRAVDRGITVNPKRLARSDGQRRTRADNERCTIRNSPICAQIRVRNNSNCVARLCRRQSDTKIAIGLRANLHGIAVIHNLVERISARRSHTNNEILNRGRNLGCRIVGYTRRNRQLQRLSLVQYHRLVRIGEKRHHFSTIQRNGNRIGQVVKRLVTDLGNRLNDFISGSNRVWDKRFYAGIGNGGGLDHQPIRHGNIA
ncbi:MAG: hypothetical protein IJL17_18990 [Kiritimatiellae bacterium]|nr:hypothetical protein [Kiritimatiellia bacterium]